MRALKGKSFIHIVGYDSLRDGSRACKLTKFTEEQIRAVARGFRRSWARIH